MVMSGWRSALNAHRKQTRGTKEKRHNLSESHGAQLSLKLQISSVASMVPIIETEKDNEDLDELKLSLWGGGHLRLKNFQSLPFFYFDGSSLGEHLVTLLRLEII